MNKFTDIFANFIEGFSFRQGSQDVKQVKKGAFLKAFTITLIIGDGVTLQFAGVQYMKVFHAVTGQFRESRYGFGQRDSF